MLTSCTPKIEHCKPHLAELRPVVECWFSVLEEYAARTQDAQGKLDDIPFWYKERPQVGFFSIAAWLSGWAALEEWGTKKGVEQNAAYGRNDLWIRRGDVEWFIEAKHAWCDLQNGREKTVETVKRAVKSATDSAKLNLDYGGSKNLATAFISLVWKPAGKSLDIKQAQDDFLGACYSTEADLIARFFSVDPEKCRIGDKEERFVGCALLMKTSA